jgi:hypothetical protein
MQLTHEQQQQASQATSDGRRRVLLSFTPEQRDEWWAAVQQELTGKEENVDRFRKIQAAAQQPGFFGDVRRAILLSRRQIDKLAQEIGVDASLLSDFQAADAELPAGTLDRLLDLLGLRLMQEIPR